MRPRVMFDQQGALASRACTLPSLARRSWLTLGLIILLGLNVGGCAPRVIVRAHPKPGDRGIRYYRPKPYLKVEPAEVAVDKTQTKLVPGVVRVSLAYLPDFSEEYAIDVRSGFGIANVGIKLEDGWNLTEISQELDSQTDENLKSAASLLSAVADVVPTSAAQSQAPNTSFTVSARNVPIGFYESIIGHDARGCKRLYGFRYVGFVPFSSCPLDLSGHQAACCNDPQAGLYGLCFEAGQMVFRPLDELASSTAQFATGVSDVAANSLTKPARTAAESGPSDPISLPMPQAAYRHWETQLRAHLNSTFDGIGEVRIESSGERLLIRVRMPSGVPSLPIRQAAEAWLLATLGEESLFDLELLNK